MFQRSRAQVLREGLNFCSFNLFLQSSRRNKKLSYELMCVLMPHGFQVEDAEHHLFMYCTVIRMFEIDRLFLRQRQKESLHSIFIAMLWGQDEVRLSWLFSSIVTMRNFLFASITSWNFSKTLTVLLLKITLLKLLMYLLNLLFFKENSNGNSVCFHIRDVLTDKWRLNENGTHYSRAELSSVLDRVNFMTFKTTVGDISYWNALFVFQLLNIKN